MRDIGETSHRPRVAFLARNMMVGGAERTYLNLANHTRHVTPVLVLLERRGDLLRQLSADLDVRSLAGNEANDSGTPELLQRIPGASIPQLLRECRRLTTLVDTLDIRVVSSFVMRTHLIALMVKQLFRPELRVVLNIHEHMSESLGYLYPTPRSRLAARWVATQLFPRADRIVVVADELKRDLAANFGASPRLIAVHRNPVDLEGIRALSREPVSPFFPDDDNRPMICALGRVVYLKGIDILLNAMAALRPTLATRLIVVGDGPERERLSGQARQLGLEDAVRFVGWQSNPWRYLARANVLALCSRTEAFPNALVEAMALGIPTVAVECTAGIRECLDDGDAGLLVPPNDGPALSRALHRVLTEPALAASLSQRGTAHVAQFGLASRVADYEAMLLEQLTPSSPRGKRTPVR